MSYAIGVVGATGQVGREFLRILEEGDRPDLPIGSLRLFASERSAGKRITVRGQELVVERAEPSTALFEGLDFVMSADRRRAGQDVLAGHRSRRARSTSTSRMPGAWTRPCRWWCPRSTRRQRAAHHGIIAGPNCSTTQMVVALWPIHQVNPIQRIVVDTYQAVSGTGWRGVDELQAQAEAAAHGADEPMPRAIYPHQIHLNVIPEIGSYTGDGLYSEERKMIDETRKIFHAPDLRISATCVRVPVAVGHSEAIHVELERPMQPDEAREILRAAPGVVVLDDPRRSEYPMPLQTGGRRPGLRRPHPQRTLPTRAGLPCG